MRGLIGFQEELAFWDGSGYPFAFFGGQHPLPH